MGGGSQGLRYYIDAVTLTHTGVITLITRHTLTMFEATMCGTSLVRSPTGAI